MIAKNTLI